MDKYLPYIPIDSSTDIYSRRFILVLACVCVCVCVCVHVPADAHGGQMMSLDSLELEVEFVVVYLMWMLETRILKTRYIYT